MISKPAQATSSKRVFQALSYSSYKRLAIVLAGAAASLSLVILIGSLLGFENLTRIQTGWVPMKANSALCVCLCSFAIILHLCSKANDKTTRVLTSIAGLLIILISGLTMIEYVGHVNLHIDELIFRQVVDEHDRANPGRPSPISAVAFLLAGVSVFTLQRNTHNWQRIGNSATLGLAALGLICVGGHLLNLSAFYSADQISAVSFQTAISYALLGFSIIFGTPSMVQRLSSSKLVSGVAALAISLIVTGAGMTTFMLMQHTVQLRKWVIHTQEVIITIQDLSVAFNGAESERATFLLTDNSKYLDSYNAFARDIMPTLNKLSDLVQDNPPQTGRLNSLRRLMQKEVDWLNTPLTGAEKTKFDTSTRDLIHRALIQLKSEEEALLKQRHETMVSSAMATLSRFACLGIVAVVNIGLAVFLLYQNLVAQERERLGQRLIYNISKRLSSQLPLSEAVSECLAVLCEQLDKKIGVFWQLSEKNVLECISFFSMEPFPNFEASSREMTFSQGVGLPGRVWKNLNTEWIVDVVNDSNFPRAQAAQQDNVHAAMAFPIIVGTAFFGVFELFSDKPMKPDPTLLPVLDVASIDIAQMIDRKMAEERLAKQAKLDAFAAEVAEMLSQNIDLAATFRFFTESMAKHLNLSIVRIWKYNAGEDLLELQSSTGENTKIENMGAIVAMQSKLGKIGAIGETFVSNDLSQQADLVNSEGLVSFAAFPLMLGAEFLGIAAVFSRERLSIKTVQMIERVTAVLTLSIKRKTVEEALKSSERKFRAIFDHTFEFIWLLSPEGIILEGNKTALDFASLDRDQVIGIPLVETAWWKHSEKLQEHLKQAIEEARQGRFVRFEANHLSKDGSSLAVDFSLKPVLDDDGNVILLIPEGRDISEKKEAEKRVSEFYSTVSHELRTPLTSIRGAFGLLEGGKAGELSSKAKHLVEMGRSESERLVRLINDILDIRKIEAGKLELKFEVIDPVALVNKTIQALTAFASDAHVTLQANFQTEARISGDLDRLTQVLTNLISNAVKFTPEGGQVVVECSEANRSLHIAVSDTGPGIKKEDLRKLFQMFAQLDSSDSRMKGGTGLGLAISKAIVEQHDGQIGVNSEYGHGSTFWVELPLIKSVVESTKPIESKKSGHANRHVVLLVEDEDAIATIITMALVDQGFEILRCATISDAQKQLESSHFDAIILDMFLPDGHGTLLIEQLKHEHKSKQIPIIVVSAMHQNHYSYPLLVDWINKPFEEKRLLSAVELAVRGRTAGPARVLIVEDDESTRQIVKDYVSSIKADIQIYEAIDGQEAIDLTRKTEPDLIILDLGLPNTDGFEVVTVLKHEKASRTPLIIYSAQDLSNDDKNKLSLGLTTHFTKSRTSESEFISCVVELLNGTIASSLEATGKDAASSSTPHVS